jgi:hypothetical protein
MKPYRILGIAGIVAFLLGSTVKFYAFIPDKRRTNFSTCQENVAYDDAWERGELQLKLQKKISDRNAAIFKYSLLAISASLLALSFRKKEMPIQERQDKQITEQIAATDRHQHNNLEPTTDQPRRR